MQADNHTDAPLNPGLVFEMVQAHQKTAALKAAIELDVFRAVGKGPGDVASIARQCSSSERGIRILCSNRMGTTSTLPAVQRSLIRDRQRAWRLLSSS